MRGLAALGFAGANVTAPHKLAAAKLDEADAPSVNTLVFRDGRIDGSSTDAAILDGLPGEPPVVLGDGGAAQAFLQALPEPARSRGAASGRPTSPTRTWSSTRRPRATRCSSSCARVRPSSTCRTRAPRPRRRARGGRDRPRRARRPRRAGRRVARALDGPACARRGHARSGPRIERARVAAGPLGTTMPPTTTEATSCTTAVPSRSEPAGRPGRAGRRCARCRSTIRPRHRMR